MANNLFPEDVTDNLAVEDIVESDDAAYGRSWKFDFEKGDFVQSTTGKIAEADPIDAWIEWCQKAIRTVRYRHVIYSDDHGQEYNDLIALNLTREANESEIERMTIECLMVNPRTERVDNFQFEWSGSKIYFTFDIYNTLDDQIYPMNESVVMAA